MMAFTNNYILLFSVYLIAGIKIQTVTPASLLQTEFAIKHTSTVIINRADQEFVEPKPKTTAAVSETVETSAASTTTRSNISSKSKSEMAHYHINLPNLINRTDWNAREPKLIENFDGPAPYVIIHHSYIPGACETTDLCKKAMQSMQNFHQNDRGWNDIGYSFAIGGDGNIYFGRGFNVIGAHAPKYNDKSVGICLIGDWRYELPSEKMLKSVNALIDYGVANGYIDKDYDLYGHRQVRNTECPGDRLFDEISKWPHFLAKATGLRKNEI